MEKKRSLTAKETAKNLARILTEHLATLSPQERAKRVKAGRKVMASGAASASGNPSIASSRSESAPLQYAARGR